MKLGKRAALSLKGRRGQTMNRSSFPYPGDQRHLFNETTRYLYVNANLTAQSNYLAYILPKQKPVAASNLVYLLLDSLRKSDYQSGFTIQYQQVLQAILDGQDPLQTAIQAQLPPQQLAFFQQNMIKNPPAIPPQRVDLGTYLQINPKVEPLSRERLDRLYPIDRNGCRFYKLPPHYIFMIPDLPQHNWLSAGVYQGFIDYLGSNKAPTINSGWIYFRDDDGTVEPIDNTTTPSLVEILNKIDVDPSFIPESIQARLDEDQKLGIINGAYAKKREDFMIATFGARFKSIADEWGFRIGDEGEGEPIDEEIVGVRSRINPDHTFGPGQSTSSFQASIATQPLSQPQTAQQFNINPSGPQPPLQTSPPPTAPLVPKSLYPSFPPINLSQVPVNGLVSIHNLVSENTHLQEKVVLQSSEISNLSNELRVIKMRESFLRQEASELSNRLVLATERLTRFEEDLNVATDDRYNAQQAVAKLSNDLRQKEIQIQELLGSTSHMSDTLKRNLHKWQSDERDFRQTIAQANTLNTQLRDEKSDLEHKLSNSNRDILLLQAALDKSITRNDDLMRELQANKTQMDSLNNQIVTLKALPSTQELEDEVTQLTQQVDALSARNRDLIDISNREHLEKGVLQAEITQKETLYTNLKSQLALLTQDITFFFDFLTTYTKNAGLVAFDHIRTASIRSICEEVNKKFLVLTAENKKVESGLRDEIQRQQLKIDEITRLNTRLQSEITATGVEITDYKNKLANITQEKSDLNDQLNSKDREIGDLKRQIQALKLRIDELVGEEKRLQANIERIKNSPPSNQQPPGSGMVYIGETELRELNDTKNKLIGVESELKSLKPRYDELNKLHLKVYSERELYERKLREALSARDIVASEQVSKLRSIYSKLAQAYNQVNGRVLTAPMHDDVDSFIAAIQTASTTLLDSIQITRSSLTSSQSSTQSIQDLIQERDALRYKLDAAEKDIISKDAEIRSLKQTINQLKDEKEIADSRRVDAESRLQTLQSTHNKGDERLKQEVDKYKQNITTLMTSNTQLSDEIDRLNIIINGASAIPALNTSLQRELQEKSEQIEVLKQQIEEVERRTFNEKGQLVQKMVNLNKKENDKIIEEAKKLFQNLMSQMTLGEMAFNNIQSELLGKIADLNTELANVTQLTEEQSHTIATQATMIANLSQQLHEANMRGTIMYFKLWCMRMYYKLYEKVSQVDVVNDALNRFYADVDGSLTNQFKQVALHYLGPEIAYQTFCEVPLSTIASMVRKSLASIDKLFGWRIQGPLGIVDSISGYIFSQYLHDNNGDIAELEMDIVKSTPTSPGIWGRYLEQWLQAAAYSRTKAIITADIYDGLARRIFTYKLPPPPLSVKQIKVVESVSRKLERTGSKNNRNSVKQVLEQIKSVANHSDIVEQASDIATMNRIFKDEPADSIDLERTVHDDIQEMFYTKDSSTKQTPFKEVSVDEFVAFVLKNIGRLVYTKNNDKNTSVGGARDIIVDAVKASIEDPQNYGEWQAKVSIKVPPSSGYDDGSDEEVERFLGLGVVAVRSISNWLANLRVCLDVTATREAGMHLKRVISLLVNAKDDVSKFAWKAYGVEQNWERARNLLSMFATSMASCMIPQQIKNFISDPLDITTRSSQKTVAARVITFEIICCTTLPPLFEIIDAGSHIRNLSLSSDIQDLKEVLVN